MTGIGWRQPHYGELLRELPKLDFIEVHSENFFAEGGAALATLMQGREHYSVSLHGVGLSLGSASGLDPLHLERLARLVERVEPLRVSDHASFARVGNGLHASDLLPISFDEESLALMVRHVDQVQRRLKRTMLVENLSAYLGWDGDTLAEPEFFNALCKQSGCGLLLDVNNLVVNARNAGLNIDESTEAACAWVDQLDAGIVGEIHLAGHAELRGIVIDDHGSRVSDSVWRVYRHARKRFADAPALIEWDTDVPALEVLLDEARRAA